MTEYLNVAGPAPAALWIPLTDTAGTPLVDQGQMHEPEPSSIVLTEGAHGTAWQRHFVDGMWHRTGRGAPKTWQQLITRRNVVLVYDAAPRGK